jgi:hypothetical protein
MARLPVPDSATAKNSLCSGDQHTDRQLLSAGVWRRVHAIPSGLVMTRFPVPELATATNNRRLADQHTERQL